MQEGELSLRLCSTSPIWIAIKQLTSRVSFKNEGARRTCFTVLELHTMRNEFVACCRWQVRVISCYKPSELEAAELKWQWFKIRGYFSGPWIWASIICQPSSFGGRITEYWAILPNVVQCPSSHHDSSARLGTRYSWKILECSMCQQDIPSLWHTKS